MHTNSWKKVLTNETRSSRVQHGYLNLLILTILHGHIPDLRTSTFDVFTLYKIDQDWKLPHVFLPHIVFTKSLPKNRRISALNCHLDHLQIRFDRT